MPFVHRLRTTDDVFGQDQHVLADLVQPTVAGRARVQFWLDEQVQQARPDLVPQIAAFCAAHDHLERVGGVQIVPGGEAIKNDIHIVERMLKVIHAADLDRRSYVVVIGGGAVLDAVGFAVAIAHRGLRLVRLPTTTLAQGDSGVGVKNAVNLFNKKNWLGSFAVPWGVVNDRTLLTSLPDREFVAGFSEAVKVALLKDRDFFATIERDADAIVARDMAAAGPVIDAAAKWHLDHITDGGDPFEMLEARPLDFGHWSAHKLEPMTDYRLRHGEAVGIGVAIDTVYSSLKFGLPVEDATRVLATLMRLGLPLSDPALMDMNVLFEGLEEFRQHLGGRLTVTMLRAIGEPFEIHEIDHAVMRQAILAVREFAHGFAQV